MLIRIIYDNTLYSNKLISGWGFSAEIEFSGKYFLFDTGADRMILEHNINTLGINCSNINAIFLSHDHCDHVGGSSAILSKVKDIPVHILSSFNVSLKKKIAAYNCKKIFHENFNKIDERIYTTGPLDGNFMGIPIQEQSLILNCEKGPVVIVGCAHTKIENVVKTVEQVFNKKIHLVLGGFHLMNKNELEIEKIINYLFKSVEKIAPTHCTGEKAISMFSQKFKNNFYKCGVGKKINI
jgi:7,8-dihydropterin-6-yl-methyl-4-(beta-D-ribofuranosyl)aminobenzene 5'-phosphate synthase